MQRLDHDPLSMPLFQISPNRSDNMLHTETVIRPRCLPQKILNETRFQVP